MFTVLYDDLVSIRRHHQTTIDIKYSTANQLRILQCQVDKVSSHSEVSISKRVFPGSRSCGAERTVFTFQWAQSRLGHAEQGYSSAGSNTDGHSSHEYDIVTFFLCAYQDLLGINQGSFNKMMYIFQRHRSRCAIRLPRVSLLSLARIKDPHRRLPILLVMTFSVRHTGTGIEAKLLDSKVREAYIKCVINALP
jgi:hypothetical protein